jgi:hypothetical protein
MRRDIDTPPSPLLELAALAAAAAPLAAVVAAAAAALAVAEATDEAIFLAFNRGKEKGERKKSPCEPAQQTPSSGIRSNCLFVVFGCRFILLAFSKN